jgi:hypothetical protein
MTTDGARAGQPAVREADAARNMEDVLVGAIRTFVDELG